MKIPMTTIDFYIIRKKRNRKKYTLHVRMDIWCLSTILIRIIMVTKKKKIIIIIIKF